MEIKSVFIIGSKSSNGCEERNGNWTMSWNMGFINGMYSYTWDVTKAKRFYSREDVCQYLLDHPFLFDGAVIKEYTEDYLEKIKDNIEIKKRLCDINLY